MGRGLKQIHSLGMNIDWKCSRPFVHSSLKKRELAAKDENILRKVMCGLIPCLFLIFTLRDAIDRNKWWKQMEKYFEKKILGFKYIMDLKLTSSLVPHLKSIKLQPSFILNLATSIKLYMLRSVSWKLKFSFFKAAAALQLMYSRVVEF